MGDGRADLEDFRIFKNFPDQLELTDVLQADQIGDRVGGELQERRLEILTFVERRFGFSVKTEGRYGCEVDLSQLSVIHDEMNFPRKLKGISILRILTHALVFRVSIHIAIFDSRQKFKCCGH